MKISKTAVALSALTLVATAGCGGGGGDDGSGGPLRIGVISPFSGPLAPGGVALAEGYQLAIDEVNADGGVMGRQIELVRGDASTPEQGISEVDRLASSEDVDVFAGTYTSGISNTASEAALRSGKLYWDTTALAIDLTERGLANFVRSGPSAEQFAEVSVDAVGDLIAPELGDPSSLSVCITHEDSIYGQSVSKIQEEALTGMGLSIAAKVSYSAAATSLGNVVLRCQKANPDIWVNTGYAADNNLLLQTAAQEGFQPGATMLVGTGDTKETGDAVGAPILDGVLVTAYAHNDTAEEFAPGIAEFLTAYDKKYDGEPVFGQTLGAYSGMKVMLEAIEEAGSTEPAAVKKTLAGLKEPLGSLPAGYGVDFSAEFQNTLALPTVVQWQGGKTVTVYPPAAAADGAELADLARK